MVNIKISNRLLYTFIAIILVVAIIGVGYAIAPNPGHTAGEIEGVCHSDGTGCPNYYSFSQFDTEEIYYAFTNSNIDSIPQNSWITLNLQTADPDTNPLNIDPPDTKRNPYQIYKPKGANTLKVVCTAWFDGPQINPSTPRDYKYCLGTKCSSSLTVVHPYYNMRKRATGIIDVSALNEGWYDFIPQGKAEPGVNYKYIGYCTFLFY